jgi:inorganic pyrophosphatase
LKKVLPVDMEFSYNFGFVSSTLAAGGDPMDVLVVMDEPAFPACLMKCRVLGIIEGVQGNGKDKQRNDRIIAIEKDNHSYTYIKQVRDLGKKLVQELKEFLVNYHEHLGKKLRVLDVKGPSEARRRIADGMRANRC